MEKLKQLREIYGAYIEKTVQLQKDRKLLQGVFGFGGRLGDDPCHAQFAEDVAAAVADVTAEEAAAVMEYVLKTPEQHKDNGLAYWMLLAVHGKVSTVADKLSTESASALLTWDEKQYPKRMRLPVQKELLKQLKAAAK